MEARQVFSAEEHYARAASLSADTVVQLRALAQQLDGRPVLPIVGAGGSYDCGMRLATQIGEDLYDDYKGDASYNHVKSLTRGDLGMVAEAIGSERDHEAAVAALGLGDPVLWPATDEIADHFCAYRVMARFAREGAWEEWNEVISFNYDCGYEGALKAEGFLRGSHTAHGREWRDHARVIADVSAATALELKPAFDLYKVHGCAEQYRKTFEKDPAAAADAIIVERRQLLSWRDDLWARNVFRDRAQNRVLLLIGFSGLDPVIYNEIQEVLGQVYGQNGTLVEGPRVIVVDYEPDTAPLRGLVNIGSGNGSNASTAVTQVRTSDTTTTAAALVLLTEWLAQRLSSSLSKHGVELPGDIDGRLAALTISGPVMLRWSYLLRRPTEDQFAQFINLQQAAERGYVPLTLDPVTTARALRTRAEIREALGLAKSESTSEALGEHGFIVDPTRAAAYLPVGLYHEELKASCRGGADIELGHPRNLECILVSDDDGHRGVHLNTGQDVPVP